MQSANWNSETVLKVLVVLAMIACLVGCVHITSGSGTSTQAPPEQTTITSGVYVIQNPGANGAGSAAILQFATTASGSVSPTGTITAPADTSFDYLATDGAGNVYASTHTQTGGDVREYAAGATGAATPVRSLPFGTSTQLGAVQGLAASSTGEIFVSEDSGGVAAFSATATGNVAPARYILAADQNGGGLSTLISANDVVADSSGDLYVVNLGGLTTAIDVFSPTATGNVAPIRVLNTTGNGQAIDSDGNLYVTQHGSILVFAPGASGNDAPIRTISGALTELGILGGIKLDSDGNIYVVSIDSNGGNPTVLRFAAGADGNVAPVSSFTSTAWTNPDNGLSLAVY